MKYIKIGVHAGNTTANSAITPFHNFLVNSCKNSKITAKDIFQNLDYLQIFIVVGGKRNFIEKSGVGKVGKLRGKNAYFVEIYISKLDVEVRMFGEFKSFFVELFEDAIRCLTQTLERAKQLKQSEMFWEDINATLSNLKKLSLNRFEDQLTLIEEARIESEKYWESKEIESIT